jgi:hypothetical protein
MFPKTAHLSRFDTVDEAGGRFGQWKLVAEGFWKWIFEDCVHAESRLPGMGAPIEWKGKIP